MPVIRRVPNAIKGYRMLPSRTRSGARSVTRVNTRASPAATRAACNVTNHTRAPSRRRAATVTKRSTERLRPGTRRARIVTSLTGARVRKRVRRAMQTRRRRHTAGSRLAARAAIARTVRAALADLPEWRPHPLARRVTRSRRCPASTRRPNISRVRRVTPATASYPGRLGRRASIVTKTEPSTSRTPLAA